MIRTSTIIAGTAALLTIAAPRWRTPIAAATTPSRSASSMRAEDIWARSKAAYASLQSYADSGTVEIEYGSVAGPLRDRHTFRTYFRKPRFFYFDFVKQGNADRLVVWSDLDAFHGWWKLTGVETTYPKGSGSGAFTTGVAITKGSITMTSPLLFPGAGLVGTTTEFADPTDAGLDTLSGHPCHRLVGIAKSVYPQTGHEVNVRRTTIWIDSKTFLIRKVFEDTPKGTIAGAVNRVTTTFQPHANPSLQDDRFKFTPPEAQ